MNLQALPAKPAGSHERSAVLGRSLVSGERWHGADKISPVRPSILRLT
jgi:hypothetical protein